jgi:cysteine-rich repeat protein
VRTKCGNGMQEGSEPCDDGEPRSGRRLHPFCRREAGLPPPAGACNTACGDGLLLPADMMAGRRATTATPGRATAAAPTASWSRLQVRHHAGGPGSAAAAIIYRDFKAFSEPGGHPDFERVRGHGRKRDRAAHAGPMGKPVHVMGPKAHT